MDDYLELKKKRVLQAAREWWSDKPDPGHQPFICDRCNGPIREKEGTSYLDGWMRCANCTQRLFSDWDEKQTVEKIQSEPKPEVRPEVQPAPAAVETEDTDQCFFCRKRRASTGSARTIQMVPKSDSSPETGDGNSIQTVKIQRCPLCKWFGILNKMEIGCLIPFVLGLIAAVLIRDWSQPFFENIGGMLLRLVIFWIVLEAVLIISIKKILPAKDRDPKEHADVRAMINKGWKIRPPLRRKKITGGW